MPEDVGVALLFERARAGQSESLAKLTAYLWPIVLAYARSKIGVRFLRRCSAEDVAQSAFLEFFRALPGYPHDLSEADIVARMRTLIVRQIQRTMRKRHEDGISTFPLEESPDEKGETGNVTRTDDVDHLRGAVAAMPERHRDILQSYLVLRQSVAEIAISMGISVDDTRKRLQRARAELTTMMQRRLRKLGLRP